MSRFAINKKAAYAAKKERNKKAHKRRDLRAKRHRQRGERHHKSEPLPAIPDFPRSENLKDLKVYNAGAYSKEKWGEWFDGLPPLATLDYALEFLENPLDERAHWNGAGEVKIPGYGGLHINVGTGLWRIHDTEFGGGLPELIAFRLSSEENQKNGSVLVSSKAQTLHRRLAAVWCGVPYPAFSNSKTRLPKLDQKEEPLLYPPPPLEYSQDEIEYYIRQSSLIGIVDCISTELPPNHNDRYHPNVVRAVIMPALDGEPPEAAPPWPDLIPPPSLMNELETLYPTVPSELKMGKVYDILMKDGQYVGDLIDFTKLKGRTLIQAPTASRKTTSGNMQLQAAGIPYDWFSPTQDLAKQIANDERYGQAMTLVMQNHNPSPQFKYHSSTYNGAAKIERYALKNGHRLDKRVAVIDEVHHNNSDGFRRQTIIETSQITDRYAAKIGMSATMPKFVYGFEGATLYRIFKETPDITPTYFLEVTDDLTLIEFAKSVVDLPLIHINSKATLKALQEEVKGEFGYKMALFTAETKETAEHEAMVLRNEMPNSDLVGCTSLINDGYSFYDDRSHAYFVSHKSNLTPHDIVQFCARIRNREHCKGVYIYRQPTITDETLKAHHAEFDIEHETTKTIRIAKTLVRTINNAHDVVGAIDPDVTNVLAFEISKRIGALCGIRLGADGLVEIDMAAIHQRVNLSWAYACNANWALMAEGLKEYGLIAQNLSF